MCMCVHMKSMMKNSTLKIQKAINQCKELYGINSLVISNKKITKPVLEEI